jgi:hypothetical protein
VVEILSHPFRFVGGRPATVETGTDAAAAEAIVIVAGVEPGERDLVPDFGLAAPTFGAGTVDVAGLNAQLAVFGPPGVRVDEVAVELRQDRTSRVVLTYTNGGEVTDAGS